MSDKHVIRYLDITDQPQVLPPALKIFDLTGKVAVVTGASSGLGREMAKGLAMAGAKVMLVARGEAALAETKQELSMFDVDYITADVAKSADVQRMVDETCRRFGRIDVLVNDAGTTFRCSFEDFPEEEYDRVVDTNMKSCFLCTKYAGRVMLRQGTGSIINIGSGAGGVAIPQSAAYCGSKGGMVQLTKAAAIDWCQRGVRVNILMPGTFHTPLLQYCMDKDPTYERRWLERHPIGRFGEPDEIVGIIIYLASDNSKFMTGNVIYLDGGGHAT